MATHLRAIALLAAVLTGSLALTGCSGPESPSSITIDPDSEKSASLTALERGDLRREALAVARDGWDAFAANDPVAMAKHFEASLVSSYEDRYDQYAAEGRERHRDYEVDFMDVTQMSSDGTVVTVSIAVVDNSYFVEADGTTTEPSGQERSVIMTLTRDETGPYTITGMTSAMEFLE